MKKTKQEIVKELFALPEEKRSDLDYLIKIEEEYQLGYNHIVEALDKKCAKKFYVLHNYCHFNALSILLLLKNNKKLNDKDLSNEEIVERYTGLKAKMAENLVKVTDEEQKKQVEIFGTKFARALSAGIGEIIGGKYYFKQDGTVSKPEDRFVEAFEQGWDYEDICDDIFGA